MTTIIKAMNLARVNRPNCDFVDV